jgi:hypothetical protein
MRIPIKANSTQCMVSKQNVPGYIKRIGTALLIFCHLTASFLMARDAALGFSVSIARSEMKAENTPWLYSS